MSTQKPHHRYWFYRAYAIIAIAVWNIAIAYSFARNEPPGLPILLLVPIVLPAIFMAFNLMAIKYPFSIFGPLQPSGFPAGEALATSRGTSGKVGLLQATVPFFSWFVFREGLGFSCLGVGKGFIPIASIQRTEKRFFGGFTVWHGSPEVRSPLTVPSSSLHEALAQVMAAPSQPL